MRTEEALRRFRSLAQEFREAARVGNLSQMNELLDRRHDLLGILERKGLARVAQGESLGARRALLEEILEFDREAEQLLERHRDQLGAEISKIQAGERGLRGYAGAATRGSKWIDEHG